MLFFSHVNILLKFIFFKSAPCPHSNYRPLPQMKNGNYIMLLKNHVHVWSFLIAAFYCHFKNVSYERLDLFKSKTDDNNM